MDGYGRGIAVWCHIVGAGHFVELFACVDASLWESKVSHGLKEYYMVHAPKGAFEVGVRRVDLFFTYWCLRISLCVWTGYRISFYVF
jgi:hypothetical protein